MYFADDLVTAINHEYYLTILFKHIVYSFYFFLHRVTYYMNYIVIEQYVTT